MTQDLQELQEERIKEFREKFVRDDGLMDKYFEVPNEQSEMGYDIYPTAEVIESFLKESIRIAWEKGFAEGEYQPNKTVSLTKEYKNGFVAGLSRTKEIIKKGACSVNNEMLLEDIDQELSSHQ